MKARHSALREYSSRFVPNPTTTNTPTTKANTALRRRPALTAMTANTGANTMTTARNEEARTRYTVPSSTPATTAYTTPTRPGTFAATANTMIPATPRSSDVGVYDTRRIIHGAIARMAAATTSRSAIGGRRRSVKTVMPITAHATIWSAYSVIPYHGRCGNQPVAQPEDVPEHRRRDDERRGALARVVAVDERRQRGVVVDEEHRLEASDEDRDRGGADEQRTADDEPGALPAGTPARRVGLGRQLRLGRGRVRTRMRQPPRHARPSGGRDASRPRDRSRRTPPRVSRENLRHAPSGSAGHAVSAVEGPSGARSSSGSSASRPTSSTLRTAHFGRPRVSSTITPR